MLLNNKPMEKNTVILDLDYFDELRLEAKKLKKDLSDVLHDRTTMIKEEYGAGYDTIIYYYSKTRAAELLNNKISRLEKEKRDLIEQNKCYLKEKEYAQHLNAEPNLKWWQKIF